MNEFIGSQNLQLDILHDFLAVPQEEIILFYFIYFIDSSHHAWTIRISSVDQIGCMVTGTAGLYYR